MANNDLKELLNQDINDIKGLINCENDKLTEEVIRKQARAISLNVKEHLDEFISSKYEKQ